MTVLTMVFFVVSVPVHSMQRVALVIGNSAYEHAPMLANPINDATDIGTAFERLGFDVTRIQNVGQQKFRRTLQEFGRAAAVSEVAVIFYAGHGIEVDQRNYLIPVDARLASDRDVEFETVGLDLVMRAVDGASELRLVILDACRDNPFGVSMQRAGATRSIGRGLARVEPVSQTLVAYAAKGGTVASDGVGRNSPYSKALLSQIETPGLELDLMFRRVRDEVLRLTGGRQEPFTYGSLSSQGAYLAQPVAGISHGNLTQGRPVTESENPQIQLELLSLEREFWESIKISDDVADFHAYLNRFSNGIYVDLARNRIKRLEKANSQNISTSNETDLEAPASKPPTPDEIESLLGLNRSERRKIQQGLEIAGFSPGTPDGLFGRNTRIAIGEWQSSRGFQQTGFLDAESSKELIALVNENSIGLLEDVMKIFSKALSYAERIEDRSSRARAYSKIALAQVAAGDTQNAKNTFSKALSSAESIEDIIKRTQQYRNIAEAQVAAGDIENAKSTLSKALLSAERIEDTYSRFLLLLEIAWVQSEVGYIRESMEIASEISNSPKTAELKEQPITYPMYLSHLAAVNAKVGNVRVAEKYFSNAITFVEAISGSVIRSYSFSLIALSQSSFGNVAKTKEAVQGAMRTLGIPESDINVTTALRDQPRLFIVEALLRIDQLTDARAIAELIYYEKFRANAFAQIVEAYAQTGDVQEAKKFFSKALQLIGEDKLIKDRLNAGIASVQAGAGDFKDAQSTAERIEDNYYRASAYTNIASSLALTTNSLE